MAALVTLDSDHAQITENYTVENGWWGFGNTRTRNVYVCTLKWPCDEDGAQGETIPSSYTNAEAVDCSLVDVDHQWNSQHLNGYIVATYEGNGAWQY